MEGEAARFIFSGAEITVTVVKESAKGIAQLLAFFRAMTLKEKLYGETGLKRMLRTGEQIVIGKIPEDRIAEFVQRAKEYGLPYHAVTVEGDTLTASLGEDRMTEFARYARESGLSYQMSQTVSAPYEVVFEQEGLADFENVLTDLGITKKDVTLVYTEFDSIHVKLPREKADGFREKAGVAGLDFRAESAEVLRDVTIDRTDKAKLDAVLQKMGFDPKDVPITGHGRCDVMFKRADIEKFNALIERIGLTKEDVPLTEFTVGDVRESVKSKLEDISRAGTGGSALGRQEQQSWKQTSRMSQQDIQMAVAGINSGKEYEYNPLRWKAYLEVQAAMYDYSEKNKKRIYQQKPDATIVMSKSRWAEAGRQVVPEANGLKITMPEIVDGRQTENFVDATVYDISETAGAEVEITSRYTKISEAELVRYNEAIRANHEVMPMDDALAAALLHQGEEAFFDTSGRIMIKEGLPPEREFFLLNREVVQAKCFAEQGSTYSRANNRFRAESVAYTLCVKNGVDVSAVDFSYMEMYQENSKGFLTAQKELVARDISDHATAYKKVLEKTKAVTDRGR
jgi:hypothetical protein